MRGYAVLICCDENVSRNVMKNLPLVANKQGICSRNININAIWVWAENTVNSGVLLHLHHQTLQFFGEPPVPTVWSFVTFCMCVLERFFKTTTIKHDGCISHLCKQTDELPQLRLVGKCCAALKKKTWKKSPILCRDIRKNSWRWKQIIWKIMGPVFIVCERWWWDVKQLMVQKSDTDQLIKNTPHKFDRVCYTCIFLYIHSVYLHTYIYDIYIPVYHRYFLVKRDGLSISFATATLFLRDHPCTQFFAWWRLMDCSIHVVGFFFDLRSHKN